MSSPVLPASKEGAIATPVTRLWVVVVICVWVVVLAAVTNDVIVEAVATDVVD